MFQVIFCLAVVLVILLLSDYLSKRKILKDEYRRKFTHILVGIFVASWPWLMSWRAIQLIGILMLVVVTLNRYKHIFKFDKHTHRKTYGDYWFALAIVICALLTTNKVFFAIAILHLALADGLAAIVGQIYGKHWKYKIFNQPKTVLGSMTFWLTSLYIFGTGLLFVHNKVDFNNYVTLLLLAPPLLTLIENISPYGSDNVLIPLAVLWALQLAQVA